MADFEEMLQSVLSDPEKMQQIMAMAQTLGGTANAGEAEKAQTSQFQGPDPEILKNLTGFLTKADLDDHQQSLLKALSPYLSSRRIQKLKKAMQAAHMAQLASSLRSSPPAGR